ncbi:MAG TPA: hypothetical protein H9870_07500 [Candidatus Corynebacterium avicola]|uniref:Uncharacterized protein n=1 Tax=Candidatus Corynebacterium avicola TaxID=2838527 RepID=A0A9D1RPQ3_9CORY|nr:hypothetical protein [Candidatus Corynebacterium avicola]
MTNAPEPADPLENLEDIDRRDSNRLAIKLGVVFPILIIATWVVLHFALGDNAITNILPIVVALGGLGTAIGMVLYKWRRYQRWQPFIGLLWWMIPVFLLTSFTLLPGLMLD